MPSDISNYIYLEAAIWLYQVILFSNILSLWRVENFEMIPIGAEISATDGTVFSQRSFDHFITSIKVFLNNEIVKFSFLNFHFFILNI